VNCKAVQTNLSAFIDRELGNAEYFEIRAHLVSCRDCQVEEQDLRCLKSLLSAMPSPDPSHDFESRLIGSIRQPAGARVSRIPFQLRAAAVFTCIAVGSALVTVRFANGSKTVETAAKTTPNFAAEVRQDQVYEADATEPFGPPLLTSAEYGP